MTKGIKKGEIALAAAGIGVGLTQAAKVASEQVRKIEGAKANQVILDEMIDLLIEANEEGVPSIFLDSLPVTAEEIRRSIMRPQKHIIPDLHLDHTDPIHKGMRKFKFENANITKTRR